MKKSLIILCSFLLFNLNFTSVVSAENIEISAKSAIVIDEKTGEIIYQKNADEIMQMASTTKIMTTLLCLESGDLDEYFTVDSDAIMVEGSSMGLLEGDLVTKRILCYGMMLPSGNDAANVTAVKIAGNLENFADLMNERASKIGMKNTNFVTPSGLDDYTDEHYSTAYDMAILTREALKNTHFREICRTKNANLEYGNPPYSRWLQNSNKLLKNLDGIIGVKTGFTDKARRCLVSACERDGLTLIAVTLNAPSDWYDHEKLYEKCFSSTKINEVKISDEFIYTGLVGGVSDNILSCAKCDNSTFKFVGDKNKLEKEVLLPKFIYAPVVKGEKLGEINYIYNNEIIFTQSILAEENECVQNASEKLNFFENILNKLKNLF